jgi:hypothetical protein
MNDIDWVEEDAIKQRPEQIQPHRDYSCIEPESDRTTGYVSNCKHDRLEEAMFRDCIFLHWQSLTVRTCQSGIVVSTAANSCATKTNRNTRGDVMASISQAIHNRWSPFAGALWRRAVRRMS